MRFNAFYPGQLGHGHGHGHDRYPDPTHASGLHLGDGFLGGQGAISTLNAGETLRCGRASETSPCLPQDGTPYRTKDFQRALPPCTYVSLLDHHDRQSHRHQNRVLSHDDRPDYL